METIFHKILSKEIPADIVYENDVVVAFKDISPAAAVHVLVIPKKYLQGFSSLEEMTDTEAGAYVKSISEVAKGLGLNRDGYRIVFNQGENGGQTVPYIHAHILGGEKLSGHLF